MLGHLSFGVEELTRAGEFYDRVLAPLGYVRVWANERGIGFGEKAGGDKLALFARPGHASAPGAGFHLAFQSAEPSSGRCVPRRGGGRRRPGRRRAGPASALRSDLLRRVRGRSRRPQDRGSAPVTRRAA